MRASLIQPIESRDGTLAKDSLTRNLLRDPFQPEKVMKRPAVNKTDLYAPAGQSFGTFVFNDFIYIWTDQTPADYPAVYDYVPDYWWGSGGGGGGGMYWENDQQIIGVPEDVFKEIEIGDTVTISGVSPSGYNGSCLVVVDKKTAAQMGVGNGDSILITNLSNPGPVVQGGVAKKLRKCSDRPAFPRSQPGFVSVYISPSATFSFDDVITSDTGYVQCSASPIKYNRSYVQTRYFKADGVTILIGTTNVIAIYNDALALLGSIITYSNVGSVGTGQYTVLNGVIQSGVYCNGSTIPTQDTRVNTTLTIAQSNAVYEDVAVYNANKAAYDAMCCP